MSPIREVFVGRAPDGYVFLSEIPWKQDSGWETETLTILTPEQAAVIAAAKDLIPLARLGAWTLEHIRGDCAGDVDAFAVQDEAVRLGVIAAVPAPKPCGPCCICEEEDAEFCYRDTESTARARDALRAQEGA